jgi:hypothetical protein
MLYRRLPRIVATVWVLSLIAVSATPAHADFVVLTNPNQFAAGSTLITFDEGDFDGHFLQPFDVVTSYRGIGLNALGASNQPTAAFDPTPPREFGPGGNAGKTIIQVQFPPFPAQGLEITLTGPVTQFGAEFLAVTPGDFTFTLFAGNQQVDVVTIAAGTTGQQFNFLAFQDTTAFDRVIVRGPGVNDGRVIMDNMEYGPVAAVPEPSTLVLAGLGLGGMACTAWRRRWGAIC